MFPWFPIVASAAPHAMPKLEMPGVAYDLDAYEMCYPSGLRVQVIRRPESRVVAIGTVIGGGTSAETADSRGAAHLVEHLWFRSHPAGGPSPWELAAGLDVNARTSADATVFTTVGGPDDLPGLLALEVQRLVDPLQGIDTDTFDAERWAVASEVAWRNEDGERAARRILHARLWPADHPYAVPLDLPEVQTVDALRAWVTASYRPEHTSMRIEGDVDPNQISALVESLFPPALLEGSASCDRKPGPPTPPDPPTTELTVLAAPVWRPRLYLAWSLPPAWGNDEQRLRYTVAYLGDAIWEALWSLHGVQDQRDFDRSCTFEPGWVASTAVCTVELPTEAAAREAWPVLRAKLGNQWAFEDDLYRRHLLGEVASAAFLDGVALLDGFDADSVSARAMSTWTGGLDPTTPIVDQALFADHPGVATLAEQWIRRDRTVGLLLVPNQANAWNAESATEHASGPPVVPPWRPGTPAVPVTTERLANGLDTWVVRRPDAPWLARASVISAGGWATSPKPGASEVMQALERYDLPISLDELRAKVALINARFLAPTAHTTTLWTPAANLDLAFWVQKGLTAQVMDFSERQAILDRRLEYGLHLATQSDPSAIAGDRRLRWLLSDDRAGMAPWDGMVAARHVGENEVRAWQRTVRRPSTSVLLVASPIDPTLVRGDASRMLESWRDKGKPLPVALPALPPPPDAKAWVIPYALSALTDVSSTCRLPGRTDTNAAAHRVLRALLAEDLRSLREGQGVYLVEVAAEPVDPRVSLLTLSATTAPAAAAGTAGVFRERLAAVAAGPSPETLARGRLAAEGEVARLLASSAGTFALLSEAAAEGRTAEGVRRLQADIREVGPTDLAVLLGECVGHEATTLVGPVPAAVQGERVDWVVVGADLVKALR